MKLPDSMYTLLKWICCVVSPALCTFIITLSNLWGWQIPTDAIVGTISALTLFIGAILGFSTAEYRKTQELTNED